MHWLRCNVILLYKLFETDSTVLKRFAKNQSAIHVIVIFLVLGMGMFSRLEAQTWTGNAFTNDWNTAANWSTNSIPATNATVTVPEVTGGRLYPVISTGVQIATLDISNYTNAGSVTVTNGGSLTVTNTLEITPNGRLIAENNATITHTGNNLLLQFAAVDLIQLNIATFSTSMSSVTLNGNIRAENGSTVTFSGSLNISSGYQINAPNSTVTLNGKLELQSNTVLDAQTISAVNPLTNGNNRDIVIGSTARLQAETLTLSTVRNLSIASDGQLIVTDSGSINVGQDLSLGSSNSVLNLTGVNMTIGGDFNSGSGTTTTLVNSPLNLTADFTVNGTVNFGSGNSTFTATSQTRVRSGGVINLISADAELDFFGVAEIENNGTLNVNDGRATFHQNISTQGDATITVDDGSVEFLGDGTFANSTTIEITGSGSMFVGGNGTFQNSGSVSVGSGSLTMSGDATFQNSGTLDAGSGTVTLSGDVTLAQSGGTLDAGTSTIIFEGGTFDNSGTFNPDESTFIFSGDGSQTVTGSNSDIEFYNLEIDENSDVTSFQNVTVLNNMEVDPDANYENENNTTLNVVGDVTGDPQILGPAPYMLSIEVLSASSIKAVFSKAMNTGPLETIGNYKVRDLLSGAFTDAGSTDITGITSAVQDGSDPAAVIIQLQGTIQEDKNYYLWVQNLTSTDNNSVSSPHRKLFVDASPPIFYSAANGNWDVTSSWATGSHTGTPATRIPGQSGDQVVIGNNNTISVASNVALAPLQSVTVNATGTLAVANGGTLVTSDKIITGDGAFDLQSGGSISIGSADGITAGSASGNVQTTTRTFSIGANYTYNGNAAQNTGDGLPVSVNNLIVNNANGVTLTANTAVDGTLTLDAGDFIISSDRSLVADNPTYNGGQFRALRSITVPQDGVTPGGWRLLSSPINTTYASFLSGITTQGFTGSSLGNTFNDTALDTTYATLMPSVLWYNETIEGTDNQRWRTLTDAANTISSGRGYFTYIFGNITGDQRYNQSSPQLEVTGQQNEGSSGTVSLPVNYTPTGDDGWNLVGNPFLAAIDWDEASGWTKTNMGNTIYVWDENTGQFRFWNGTTGTLNDPLNQDNTTGSGIIMPFQAFWVKAEAASPVLSVNQNAKTTGGQTTFYRQLTNHDEIELVFETSDLHARTFLMFTDEGRSDLDAHDAYRLQSLAGTYLDVYTVSRDGERLAINNLPNRFARTLEIPLNIDGMDDNAPLEGRVEVRLGARTRIPHHWDLEIIDNQSGDTRVLSASADGFSFNLTETAGQLSKAVVRTGPEDTVQPEIRPVLLKSNPETARFTLRITPNEASEEIPAEFALSPNYPNPFNPTTNIPFAIAEDGPVQLQVFDVTGRLVQTLVNDYLQAGRYDVRFDAAGLASGIYLIQLTTLEGSFTQKVTLIR